MDFIFIKSSKAGKEDYGSIYARVRSGKANMKVVTGFTIKQLEWEKYRSLRDKVWAVRPSPREDKGGIRGGRVQPKGGQEHHRERETRRAQRNDADCRGQTQGQNAV